MKLMILQKSGRLIFFLLIISLAGSGLWGTVQAAKEIKAGYYDLERLRSELPFFQKINEIYKEKDAELEAFRGNLYKDYLSFYDENIKKFNKEASGKSENEKNQLFERFQTQINNRIKTMNDQLEKKRLQIEDFKMEQTRAANEQLKELVAAVASKKKLAFVVDKSMVLSGGTDITKDIIKKVMKDEKRDKTK